MVLLFSSHQVLIIIFFYLQDINQINTHADEMDLFTMVTRRFKKVFSKQEQLRTFPVYDASVEVSTFVDPVKFFF